MSFVQWIQAAPGLVVILCAGYAAMLLYQMYKVRKLKMRLMEQAEKIRNLSPKWLDELGTNQDEVTQILKGLRELPPGYRVPLNEVPVRIQGLGMLKTWISQYCHEEAEKYIEFAEFEEKQGSLVYLWVCQGYILKRMLEEALGLVKS